MDLVNPNSRRRIGMEMRDPRTANARIVIQSPDKRQGYFDQSVLKSHGMWMKGGIANGGNVRGPMKGHENAWKNLITRSAADEGLDFGGGETEMYRPDDPNYDEMLKLHLRAAEQRGWSLLWNADTDIDPTSPRSCHRNRTVVVVSGDHAQGTTTMLRSLLRLRPLFADGPRAVFKQWLENGATQYVPTRTDRLTK